MSIYPISETALDGISTTHNPSKPVFMLNLWRYRDTALYAPEHAHLSSAPCSGREAIEHYNAAIASVVPPGAMLHFVGNFEGLVAGPQGEAWDRIILVRYETLQGFRDMVASTKYKEEVLPHRLAGVEEWRLIALDGVAGVGL